MQITVPDRGRPVEALQRHDALPETCGSMVPRGRLPTKQAAPAASTLVLVKPTEEKAMRRVTESIG